MAVVSDFPQMPGSAACNSLPIWQFFTPPDGELPRTSWRVFPDTQLLVNDAMKTRKPINYLRSYRLRWGLSQRELAHFLGSSRPEVVSRIEKKQRPPTRKLVIACFILFWAAAAELFPDISASIEADVMTRIWEVYEKIQGDPFKKTKKKIDLFEAAIALAEQGKHAPHS
ncbi:transcriptional regulator with XRE-family HTH domain [Bradyrhizobium sp. LM2.7]